jgi:O-antigen/teichoic acid export membrane protein
MSRLKNYTRGLASGYAVLAVNVVYTLVSLRIAWAHLSEEAFGVWVLSLIVAGYIAFVDLGMGSSLARMLIDHKDEKSDGVYGGMIKTGMLVFLIQGLIVLIAGVALSFLLPGWLKIPGDLQDEFFWLMIGQTTIVMLGFQTRIFNQILYAHQRMDLQHIAQIAQFGVNLFLLWRCFHAGLGVYSLLVAQFGGWLVLVSLCIWSCRSCGLLPQPGKWGRANRRQFRELFAYGQDIFWIGLGTQFITTSQAIVISHTLGVKTAAIWAVVTKAFTLVTQLVFKTIGIAAPILGEMHSRGERERLRDRHRVLFRTISAFSGWCAVVFVFCNRPFLAIWMEGEVSWATHHDWLLGFWLILLTQQGIHSNLIMAVKQIKGLKLAYLGEGSAIVAGGLLFFGARGMDWLIGWSIVCTFFFTSCYSVWRVRAMFGLSFATLLWEWQKSFLGIVAVLLPLGWVVNLSVAAAVAMAQFIVLGLVLGLVGAAFFLRLVLPEEWSEKLQDHLPSAMRPLFRIVCGRKVALL